jgi:hypothetical protein
MERESSCGHTLHDDTPFIILPTPPKQHTTKPNAAGTKQISSNTIV